MVDSPNYFTLFRFGYSPIAANYSRQELLSQMFDIVFITPLLFLAINIVEYFLHLKPRYVEHKF